MKNNQQQLTEVLTFWFEELTPEQWFGGGAELDATITDRFVGLHAKVATGETWQERVDVRLALAEVIVLDQFSRQIYRESGQAFAYDGMALVLAQHVVASGQDQQLTADERQFLYLPFTHSESKIIHEQAVVLFENLGKEVPLKQEHIHKNIIDQFGRYPHRNQALGREMTKAEAKYLENNDESFF